MRLIKKMLVLSTLSAALAAASVGVSADTKPTIKIGYVEGWDDSVATSNVAARIIEKRLGYQVQLVPVAAGVMWQGVARGDLDATLSAWLPVTHGAYWNNFKDEGRRPGPELQRCEDRPDRAGKRRCEEPRRSAGEEGRSSVRASSVSMRARASCRRRAKRSRPTSSTTS